jgi:hypothetical protein
MSAGQQVNDVLVIEPTTTAWMYNGAGKAPAELERLGKSFQDLLNALERGQVEYDIGCEDVMARHGAVEGSRLRVGRRSYRTVVVAPFTENLNAPTVALLDGFLKAGGSVVAAGPPPERVDGVASDRGPALATRSGWKPVPAVDVPAALTALQNDGFAIARRADDRGILFHQRRQVEGGELLLLVNTSIESRSAGMVEAVAGGVEEWNPATGRIRPFPFERTARGVRLAFDLPEAGSLLVRLTKATLPPTAATTERLVDIAAAAPPAIRRVGPNVLVLDYLDVRAGGENIERTYVYQASQFAFQKNGVERNPWDSAVQFRDELITRTFPATSGVEATYRFTIKDRIPTSLSIVVERPDLYAITCNGQAVVAAKGQWWLDRAFGRIDIAAAARVGENAVVLKASPFTMQHELESAYVLGDFTLEGEGNGFVVSGLKPLGLGPWNGQGHPFYSQGVAYTERFAIAQPSGTYRVRLGRWLGSVARVAVNGKPAGEIYASPWTLDVTGLVRPGTNEIEVTVIGTLKNTLGPHHNNPALGTAWPGMFQKAPSPGPPPGSGYSTVGYGLFEPFALVQAITK